MIIKCLNDVTFNVCVIPTSNTTVSYEVLGTEIHGECESVLVKQTCKKRIEETFAKKCSCGKDMKFHDKDSDEPIEIDTDEIDGSFWYCSCGKFQFTMDFSKSKR